MKMLNSRIGAFRSGIPANDGLALRTTAHARADHRARNLPKADGTLQRFDVVPACNDALVEAVAMIEQDARHAFVVCGQPDTQEAFEAAWFSEDPDHYEKWLRLSRAAFHATDRTNEIAQRMGVRLSAPARHVEPVEQVDSTIARFSRSLDQRSPHVRSSTALIEPMDAQPRMPAHERAILWIGVIALVVIKVFA